MTVLYYSCVNESSGRDDIFCLSATGQLTCWANKAGSSEKSPLWTSLGLVKDTVAGYMKDDIRLGDIDGDGEPVSSLKSTFAHIVSS